MKNKSKNSKNKGKLIKEALVETLGLEVEDINEDDSLSNDLHMRPSDLADFVEKLSSLDIDTSNIQLADIETVADLISAATDDEYYG